jgi:hypothetical protein
MLNEEYYCDKIGAKINQCCGCEDYFNTKNNYYITKRNKNNIRTNKHKRKLITKNKLIKLSKIHWSLVYIDEVNNRYKKIYYSGRKGVAKWCSKRKVRNSKGFSLKGAGYRKCFDYWNCVF